MGAATAFGAAFATAFAAGAFFAGARFAPDADALVAGTFFDGAFFVAGSAAFFAGAAFAGAAFAGAAFAGAAFAGAFFVAGFAAVFVEGADFARGVFRSAITIACLCVPRNLWHARAHPANGAQHRTPGARRKPRTPQNDASPMFLPTPRPLPLEGASLTVLGVESSCDETAASVVCVDAAGAWVRSDVVATQVAEHAPYGGVVPEIAARAHLRAVGPVIERAVREGGGWESIDAVAATAGPGLIGALLVGLQAAKAVAWARGLPFVGVNHLAGHLLAPFTRVEGEAFTAPAFPFVGLLASGGHTAIYRCDDASTMRELGATRDDAAGEAFDKVAKMLGLGYPGGPVVDRLAARGDAGAVTFPQALRGRSLEFSFSGLKTAVATHLGKHGAPASEQALCDLCAGVQRAIVETLVRKLLLAARLEGVPRVVLGGGVAANRGLRAHAAAECARAGVTLVVPPLRACTDNAAMIAYAGAVALRAGRRDGLDLDARASWPVGS